MAGQARRRASVGDTLIKSSFDRILAARGTPSFDAVLVEELQRVATMLGDVISGANESGGFAQVTAPVENYGAEKESPTSDRFSRDDMAGGGVHVHLHGGADAPEGDPNGAVSAGGAGAAAGAEGGGGDLEQRVSALERAVAILAQEEGGEDPQDPQQETGAPSGEPTETRPGADRGVMRDAKRVRALDDEPTAPPTDEPDDASSKENVAITDRRRVAVGDAATLRGPWQEMVSKAELLAPGIKYPTMDSKQGMTRTLDAMCKFRRRVLNEALQEDDTAAAVRQVASGGNVAQMSCDAVSAVFNGAAELVRQKRSNLATSHVGDGVNYNPSVGFNTNQTLQAQLRSLNTKNAEFWAKQSGR